MPAAREASSRRRWASPARRFPLALRLIALADGRFPLELLLPAPLAVAAGPRRHLTGRHEQALGAQRIQQGAVMGDQQAHALEARKTAVTASRVGTST